MLEFKDIELSDREWIEKSLSYSDFRGSEYSFGNNFIWNTVYKFKIARFQDFYIIKIGNGKHTKFLYPAGKGDIKAVFAEMKAYAKSLGIKLRLYTALKQSVEVLKEHFGDEITITEKRDYFDYIYNRSDLVSLAGKKYHSKRNHINRFMENNWSYEVITPDNIPECLEMNDKWCKENVCNKMDVASEEEKQELMSKHNEFCVVKFCFANYEKLGFHGILIRVDGVVQAFTFGEPLNSDTFIVHVEKALGQYQGAYPIINQTFASTLDERFIYINREDDTGAENLRKAKLSYKPVFLEEKYSVEFND